MLFGFALVMSRLPVLARLYDLLQGLDARMQVSAQYIASLIFAVAVGYLATLHRYSATCVEIPDTAINRLGSKRCGSIGRHLSIQMSHHGLCLSARMLLDGKLSRLAKLGIAVFEIWLCLSHLPPWGVCFYCRLPLVLNFFVLSASSPSRTRAPTLALSQHS